MSICKSHLKKVKVRWNVNFNVYYQSCELIQLTVVLHRCQATHHQVFCLWLYLLTSSVCQYLKKANSNICMTKTQMITQRKWLKSHVTLKICTCIFCKSQSCVHCKGIRNSPAANPGTWCHTCRWSCPLSKISASERASLSASVQIRLHGKSIVWENSGAKERATVLVILSSCTIAKMLTHQILKLYKI